jgi:glycosyltransferase involved in cell wall biosynthesis
MNWHLTIVGSPDRDIRHADELTALSGELGIADRVRFAGEVVGDELEELWRRADLFALATYYEGYGMVIAEALKRGLPVIVTGGGAAGALLNPRCGFVCPVGDHDMLAQSLRQLIGDRGMRQAMADQAWQTGQTLPSWETQAALFATALV